MYRRPLHWGGGRLEPSTLIRCKLGSEGRETRRRALPYPTSRGRYREVLPYAHSNDGRGNEKPVHTVYVDAFYMDKYEVTNAQYRKFVEATGHQKPSHWDSSKFNQPKQPVVNVSWDDAVAYCKWAGKRLPTEAEWEKAARGGLEGKKYPWGNSSIDTSQANNNKNVGKPTPVGNYPPNGYGLYDMAGNVWEWCADRYDRDYYKDSPDRNPTGPSSGDWRVIRGGGWLSLASWCVCAVRFYYVPNSRSSYNGFRGVQSASP